jgi:SnoaL-like domain
VIEVVLRAWRAFDAADPDAFAAAVAPDWVERSGDGATATLDDALAAIRRYGDEYDAMETTFDQVVCEGELVAVRTTTRATHRASGRRLTRYEIAIHRVAGGVLAESWSQGGSPSFDDELSRSSVP